jgi:hypothetical protein
MKKQLLTLQQLISVMDPELYRHLGTAVIFICVADRYANLLVAEKTEGLNLFFCFRCVPLPCSMYDKC